jgi:hypothetical protein
MIRFQQPTRTSCGQTCIAMIIGRPVHEVFTVLPDKPSGTRTAELVIAMRQLGLSCAGKMRRIGSNLVGAPPLAILRVLWPADPGERQLAHWMVLSDGRIFDPDGPRLRWRAVGGRITSYLEITRMAAATANEVPLSCRG